MGNAMRIHLVLAACALVLSVPMGRPQTSDASSPVDLPHCAKADLNIRFQFLREPDFLTLSILGENISAQTCAFDGALFYPSVQGVIDTPPQTNGTTHPFPECSECNLVNGRPPENPRPTVAPGQVARESFRWRTTPAP